MTQALAATGATTSGTQVAGNAPPKAGFPPFEAHTFAGQLVWFAIAFGFLYWFMLKVALPKIGAVLESRRERIVRDLDEAQAMSARSKEAEAAYEQSLAEARARSKTIAQEMRDALAAESDAKRKTLEHELAERLASAEATIRSRTGEAMSNVGAIASEAASAIVERLTGRAPDVAAIRTALDRTLRS